MTTTKEDRELDEAHFTPVALKALRRLWEESQITDSFRRSSFPGAVGRGGAALVRMGLAINCGRRIYANNQPRMGELPDAYVEFKLNKMGERVSKRLFSKKAQGGE